MDARDITLSVLLDMDTNHTFSNIAIDKALRQHQFDDKKDRAFITRLAEGVTERRITLDYIINCYSKTKVNKCKPLIRCLLRMGTYQIMYMDSVPDSAACNEMVKLAKSHGFSSLSGFVNGVLRNISRHKDDIKYPDYSIKYSVPQWLVRKLMSDYPDKAEQILDGSYINRATSIRVNTDKISREELKKLLAEKNIEVSCGVYDEKALRISGYDFIRKVPGYKQGYFTVQDESSMCAIRAADIQEGDIIYDVCSAPGGKTTAAAEYLHGTGHVYSMDISSDKLSMIEDNAKRLGLANVTVSRHDARELIKDEKTGMPCKADIVIADVPCSGLGVMGRKNDIKYRVTEENLTELVTLQREILDVVQQYVNIGGKLLYSTCTINPDENEKNVSWFLNKYKGFRMESERLFVQGIDECDGFYYAVMKRVN